MSGERPYHGPTGRHDERGDRLVHGPAVAYYSTADDPTPIRLGEVVGMDGASIVFDTRPILWHVAGLSLEPFQREITVMADVGGGALAWLLSLGRPARWRETGAGRARRPYCRRLP